jgi:hypothetical protein
VLGQGPSSLSNPTRPAQAMNTTPFRACRRTGYEGCDPLPSVLRVARIRDSAGFSLVRIDWVVYRCASRAVEKLHSRLRETKGVEWIKPFGFRYFRIQPPREPR